MYNVNVYDRIFARLCWFRDGYHHVLVFHRGSQIQPQVISGILAMYVNLRSFTPLRDEGELPKRFRPDSRSEDIDYADSIVYTAKHFIILSIYLLASAKWRKLLKMLTNFLIMIDRCQGNDTFVAFQQMASFHSEVNRGNSLFSKDVYSPSIFLGPHPYPVSLAFFSSWRPVLARFYPRIQQPHSQPQAICIWLITSRKSCHHRKECNVTKKTP